MPQPTEPKILLLWSYSPNRMGLEWFLEAVMPRLAHGTKITVAGSHADEALWQRPFSLRVPFVDTPLDLKPLYGEHDTPCWRSLSSKEVEPLVRS